MNKNQSDGRFWAVLSRKNLHPCLFLIGLLFVIVSTLVTPTASAFEAQFNPQTLRVFVDSVVEPNLNQFSLRATQLSKAINTYAITPNQQTLKEAQKAWLAARAQWEQTEAFGYGPADYLGYDEEIDTWPVNETDLNALLKSTDKLTASTVRTLPKTEKGFHVIEYFLFGAENNRQARDLNPRALVLLKLLGEHLAQTSQSLSEAWSHGVEGKAAFGNLIATAGTRGNTTYPTLRAGATQIMEGMLDSLGEVVDTKMGKIFKLKNSQLAESRFSQSTLSDLKHDVMGSQNTYLGRFPGANNKTGLSISSFVAEINPNADLNIKRQFIAALSALDKIPKPFEKSISVPQAAAAIIDAQKAVDTLKNMLEEDVKPILMKI